jgi:hypothetical protein
VPDLYETFREVVQTLDERGIPFAICGGLAMAIHARPRATVDVDLIVPQDVIAALGMAAATLGFRAHPTTLVAAPNREVERIEKAIDEMTKVAWQAEASAKEEGEWQRKGATLSDKTVRTEFGLTQDEIVEAIRAGKLHYRHTSIFGNPVLRLLRREVEALVKKTHGAAFLKDQQAKTELARIDRELRRLTTQIAALEERKSKLMARFTR